MSNHFHVSVVSMQNAKERRKLVSENLTNSNLNWSFFNALSSESQFAEDINLTISAREQLKNFGRELSASEVGCFKSHYYLINEHVKSHQFEWLLVIEDDVILDANYDFDGVIEFCQNHHINYIRLFSKSLQKFKQVGDLSNFRQIVRFKTDPYGAQAYLINRLGAQMFIKNCKSIKRPIDDELGRFWEHKLPSYAVFPYPVIERYIPSQLSQARDQLNLIRKKYNAWSLIQQLPHKTKKNLFNFFYVDR